MLKIDVMGISEKNGETLPISLTVQVEEFAEADLWCQDQVSIVGKISNVGSCLRINLKLSGRSSLECSRCLQPMDRDFSFIVEEDIEPDEVDLATGSLDLSEIVKTALAFHQPMQPLCKSDCQGLCPCCGTDRNLDPCNCETQKLDPRLAELNRFFHK